MPALTERDRRTLRWASIGISLYLVLFFGARGWRQLEAKRLDYQNLCQVERRLQRDINAHENKVLLFEKLKASLRLDPQSLSRPALAGEASAAIQKAAAGAGVKLGPVRESPARAVARELASMQLEGAGTVPAVMGLFHRLETLGFPLVIDSVQVTPDSRPGQIKITLTIVILDYDQWRKEEMPRA
jgi:hypothetical protein